jgi:hypothetical protein
MTPAVETEDRRYITSVRLHSHIPGSGQTARRNHLIVPWGPNDSPRHYRQPAIVAAMPITPYLNGVRFDPETRRALGVALEMTCIALRTGDCDDGVKQAIATKLIELAKSGERNPDILCERVLGEIRGPQW